MLPRSKLNPSRDFRCPPVTKRFKSLEYRQIVCDYLGKNLGRPALSCAEVNPDKMDFLGPLSNWGKLS